jgi:hypothetical protein
VSHLIRLPSDDETYRRLKVCAAELGIGMGALVDRAVRQYLDAAPVTPRREARPSGRLPQPSLRRPPMVIAPVDEAGVCQTCGHREAQHDGPGHCGVMACQCRHYQPSCPVSHLIRLPSPRGIVRRLKVCAAELGIGMVAPVDRAVRQFLWWRLTSRRQPLR